MAPTWLVRPTSKGWNRMLDFKPAARSLYRESVNSNQLIFPPLHDEGIWSNDQTFIRYQKELATTLSEAFQPNIDADGFAGPNAVISNFGSLLNSSGSLMSPTSVPMMSNATLAADLNLATRFLSERDQKIFRSLHEYMFRSVEMATLPIRRVASSGFPNFTSDVTVKKASLLNFNENASTILSAFNSGELVELQRRHGLFFATYLGRRVQPDGVTRTKAGWVPKPREVNDEEYSRTFGSSGRRLVADKAVYDPISGQVVDGVYAMRQRPVYSYPAAYNLFLTQFFAPFRASYLKRGEFTWKHRTPDSIVQKIVTYPSIRGFDVKQFDQSVQPWLLAEFVGHFSGFLRDDLIEFFGHVLRQPFYQPHPQVHRFQDDPLSPFNPCFGDPDDLSTFVNDVGLPSGIGPNPDIGKFLMTFAYLCLLDRHFKDVLETGLDVILSGRHDRYCLLDMGDDAVLATTDESLWSTVDSVIAGEFYFKLAPEEGISFLGNVIFRDPAGQTKAAPNVVTFLQNRLCPEFGAQHPSRRDYAGTGWFEGMKHYSSAPLFGEVLDVWSSIHRKYFRETLDVRWAVLRDAERHRGVPSLSETDVSVLESPERLFYRYDLTEVNPWVLDRIMSAVHYQDYEHYIQPFFV